MIKIVAAYLLVIISIVLFRVAAKAEENVWGQSPLPYIYAAGLTNKFGFNADIDSNEESIWDINDLPTSGAGPERCFENMGITPANLYVSSDDSSDSGSEIVIEVLDSTWTLSVITMNLGSVSGTGTAFTQIGSATLLRVNRAFATTDDFAGNIYIHKDAVDGGTDGIPDAPATDLIAGITAGENQTLQACYTVPLGFPLAIPEWCLSNVSQSAAGTAVTFRIRTSFNGHSLRTRNLISIGNEQTECSVNLPNQIFDEMTDVEVTGSDASSQASASTFGIVLIKNR